jgi:membrane carboxypeptidase/penicillin-binding protein PbpC
METATPLLFRLFNEIASRSDRWFRRPGSVEVRPVCRASGMKPGPGCGELTEDYFLPGFSTEEACTVHRLATVDAETGREVCDACSAGRRTGRVTVEVLPPDFTAWARENGRPYAQAPGHERSCERYCASQALTIRSPLAGKAYRTRGAGADQAIFFSADAPADAGKLFWFVDRKLIASGPPEQKVFFPLEPGEYRLTCLDSEGRSDEVAFSVVAR